MQSRKRLAMRLLVPIVLALTFMPDANAQARIADHQNGCRVVFRDGTSSDVRCWKKVGAYVYATLDDGHSVAYATDDLDQGSLRSESCGMKLEEDSRSPLPHRPDVSPPTPLNTYTSISRVPLTTREITIRAGENGAVLPSETAQGDYNQWLSTLGEAQREYLADLPKAAQESRDRAAVYVSQRDDFAQWTASRIAARTPPPPSPSGGDRWLLETRHGGRWLILDDHSLWEIEPLGWIDTALWLPLSDVVVLGSSDCLVPFSWLIVNVDDDEAACARLAGGSPPVVAHSVASGAGYPIEVSDNDELFIINGETFEAKTYCFGMEPGDRVVFLEGSVFGACASATLYNLRTEKTCEVWCE